MRTENLAFLKLEKTGIFFDENVLDSFFCCISLDMLKNEKDIWDSFDYEDEVLDMNIYQDEQGNVFVKLYPIINEVTQHNNPVGSLSFKLDDLENEQIMFVFAKGLMCEPSIQNIVFNRNKKLITFNHSVYHAEWDFNEDLIEIHPLNEFNQPVFDIVLGSAKRLTF